MAIFSADGRRMPAVGLVKITSLDVIMSALTRRPFSKSIGARERGALKALAAAAMQRQAERERRRRFTVAFSLPDTPTMTITRLAE
jgi:hypothetical protein